MRENRQISMKKSLATIWLAIFCLGCSTFVTTQLDERFNPTTGEKTTIRTRVAAKTFWEAQAALANFKASQTEKTQGATVGSLNQEANSTNAIRAIDALERIAVGSAVKVVK